jgi:hypothetical protein
LLTRFLLFLQVALVQLCTEVDGLTNVWLMHIARIGNRVPQALAALLADPDIVKGGRSVGVDVSTLRAHNGLVAFEGKFEVASSATSVGLAPHKYGLIKG